ncbi:MAG: DUF4430 domain-containing protein, partial [Lachnospiraceae bacterium]|nr:DUF4430 domain-containing protein [Lachnospiraceae bacterium]
MLREAGILDLPTELYGCSINWKSNQEEIISQTGVVTLPEEGIKNVVLTAEIICGSEKDSKTFSIEVWAENVDAETYLQKALEAMKWDFKLLQPVHGEDTNILVKLKELLNKKGYEGVSVSIQSTADETLISQNGRIYYPVVPEGGSFTNGKQVQVFFDLTVGEQTVTYPTTNTYALLVPWDQGEVENSLRKEADAALTEEVLCGDNESLSSVVSDLNLPSCIEGDKYSFAQITWNSSDENHLVISDENRKGSADAYYNSFVGKVYQDHEVHHVMLTAEVKNPSTDAMVSKTFEITISPMSEEQLGQTLDTMNQILACYTADKLTDYTTKEKLDLTAVKHDIGLVIPKNVVTKEELAALSYGAYWDYWNYKFTVTSSNTDVIDVNSFRAYVYRPLGSDASADQKVTLHVQMTSKENPNLSVSKDMEVTVAHLERDEINQALALMDAAKMSYEEGLLGGNTDVYSIIDHLTPYKEIVWNEDQSGVEYIYRHADRKNNGIIVDELPGWEEQEDWRLFHTSDKNQIANETLLLGETPEENTFVKINSVLTDEVFGKYYTKFRDDPSYDVETLTKFKQLYKQPVHTYVMVVGKGNYTVNFASMTRQYKSVAYRPQLTAFQQKLDKPISVSFTLLGRDGEVIIPKTTENSFTTGATVFDVFQKVLGEHEIAYTAKGSYISSVNGLAEKADGQNSGWMYTVGDVYVNSYMNAQELAGGEEIVVKYVKDYKLANTQWIEQESPKPSE